MVPFIKFKWIFGGTGLLLFFLLSLNLPQKICADTNESILIAKSKKKKTKANPHFHHLSLNLNKSPFKISPALKKAVDFWKLVYTKYDRNYEIFHDTENLGVIYSVLDFTDLYENEALDRKARLAIFRPKLEAEEQRIIALLHSIHTKQYQPQKMTQEERRIFDLFKDDPNPNKFLEAANEKRVRAQTGIKNKFIEAIRISGRYIQEFETIFLNAGLPIELSRLAFVESMFNLQARSKVGASGVWQFMPQTGKIYGLTINRIIDERNDPILAAHAATRLLKHNFQELGTWPLAMNAYNSGRGTMKRAVDEMGSTNIAKIIKYYRGGIYGFASRNFYPSFLAVLEITQNYPKYFGKIIPDKPFENDYYVLKSPLRLPDLAKITDVGLDFMMELNPHLTPRVYSGVQRIPTGYRLKIPVGSIQRFAMGEKKLNTLAVGR